MSFSLVALGLYIQANKEKVVVTHMGGKKILNQVERVGRGRRRETSGRAWTRGRPPSERGREVGGHIRLTGIETLEPSCPRTRPREVPFLCYFLWASKESSRHPYGW